MSFKNFRYIDHVGKKGAAQLLRISRKAVGVMSVMPLTITAQAPELKQGFPLVALYPNLA